MKLFKNKYNATTSKDRTPLTQCTTAKVTAFILVILMSVLTAVCALGAVIMAEQRMYSTPKKEYVQNIYTNIAYNDIQEMVMYAESGETSLAESYCKNRNIYSYRITDSNNGESIWSYVGENTAVSDENTSVAKQLLIGLGAEEPDNVITLDLKYSGSSSSVEKKYDIKISIYEEPVIDDEFMFAHNLINLCYAMLYWIYVIGILAFICAAAAFVFLICSAGHRKGYDEIRPGPCAKIPFDLVTAALIAFAVIGFNFIGALYLTEPVQIILSLILVCLPLYIGIIGWTMSLAARIKAGKWWKNTIIFRVLNLLWRGIKALFGLIGKIPLVWKTALIVAGASLVELIAMVCSWNNNGSMMMLWFSSTLIFGTAILYCAVKLKNLQKGGEALANGDLSYQIDTSKLFGDFKKHGESLNSIAKGMTIAVEERLRSERMKTELITNVSHDIKTPLTSIINYTDLISKEPCDNEKITEYSEVLLRQSERLKRLIDDLVEASKASTGNLEVNLTPCEANILLTQAVGEYEEKLESRNLELITKQPDKPIIIMADGRRLWRVFDNLINNICKYAQASTRVYLSLEQQGDEAVITFKNTSHAPLNMPADELLERFVRGDASRNTEGNGLGLSIARSLTELQNGTLDLSIDGDLFKVTLRFPVIM